MGKFTDNVRLTSAKFPEIGTLVSGVVTEIDEDATVPHFDAKGNITGNEVDADGHDLTQIDVTIETPEGKRVIHTGTSISYAIGRALIEIGSDDLEVGDSLQVSYVADGPKKAGRNAPKQYSATVVKA